MPQAMITWMSKHVLTRSKRANGNPKKSVGSQQYDVGFYIIRFTLTLAFLIYVLLAYMIMFKSRVARASVLICDRYFYDWIYYLDKKRSTVLTKLVPKPDLIFLLDVGVPEAFSRMHSLEDKRFSAEYYSFLRKWYLTLAKEYDFKVIKSIRDFSKTQRAIFQDTISLLTMRDLFVP